MNTEFGNRHVNQAIRRTVWSGLAGDGFADRTARSAWRRWERGTDVVNFQSFNPYIADGCGCTTFSFAVNLGVRLDYVPTHPKHSRDRPLEWQCHLRLHLKKRLSQPYFRPYAGVLSGKPAPDPTDRDDIWYIKADGSNLEESMADAREVLLAHGPVWFESTRDAGRLLQLLLSTPASVAMAMSPRSVMFDNLVGWVALEAGNPDLAAKHLLKVKTHGGFGWQAVELDSALSSLTAPPA